MAVENSTETVGLQLIFLLVLGSDGVDFGRIVYKFHDEFGSWKDA